MLDLAFIGCGKMPAPRNGPSCKVIIKRYKAEQIINRLREAEVELSKGNTTGRICRKLGITEQTYYRWRRECGGMKVEQVKRLKSLEPENARLKKRLRC